jgi:hypothetical protein
MKPSAGLSNLVRLSLEDLLKKRQSYIFEDSFLIQSGFSSARNLWSTSFNFILCGPKIPLEDTSSFITLIKDGILKKQFLFCGNGDGPIISHFTDDQ